MRLGAIEAGGTSCVVGIGDQYGVIHEREELPTGAPAATFAALSGWLRARGPLDGVGVASFGPVRVRRDAADFGCILDTPKPGWAGASWTAALAPLGAPIALDTDVNAAALGEAARGAAVGARHVVYVTVGTGIGAGALVDGRPLHGVLHPEVGHVRVPRGPGDAFPGVCPFHRDCLEGLAAAPAIRARTGLEPHAIPAAHPVWGNVATLLGAGVYGLILTLSPEVVLLGGGVCRAPGLVDRVAAAVAALDGGYLPRLPRIVGPGLGADAGLVGALLLAAQGAEDTSALSR